MFLGRYEIHHRRDNGLIRKRICSKCKRKFPWFSHIFGLNYYHTTINKSKRSSELKELIHSGKLENRYPILGQAGWYATVFAASLPKWPKSVRLSVIAVVIGLVVVGVLKVF